MSLEKNLLPSGRALHVIDEQTECRDAEKELTYPRSPSHRSGGPREPNPQGNRGISRAFFRIGSKASSGGGASQVHDQSMFSRNNNVGPSIGNPGLSLFSANSGESPESKIYLLGKMFSWGHRGSGHTPEEPGDLGADPIQTPGLKPSLSLVPPNYTQIFVNRSHPIQSRFSRNHWALETVVFSNNGIRREIIDMYKMFHDMERRPLMLTVNDMDVFFEWFGTLRSILAVLFDVEETCLYAWIEGKDLMSREAQKWEASSRRIRGPLSEGRRRRLKGDILQLASHVENYSVGAFEGRPVVEGLPGLAARVDQFVSAVLVYSEAKEMQLPRIMQTEHGMVARDRKRYESHLWPAIVRQAPSAELAGLTTIAATRWMDRRMLRVWKRRYFSGRRIQYESWHREYMAKRYTAVRELEKRITSAEEEHARQILEHAELRARVLASDSRVSNAKQPRESEVASCASSMTSSRMSLASAAVFKAIV